ncbi:jg650 [Pararge aegeria aegeria]|uniref:Jg650 protein n=1 Tax=Pararge aegeria aegeria TaxID=348720 RepID=A0A8S4QS93_9NEOP|nr:jg650 [Pararge aegeria aegeria]
MKGRVGKEVPQPKDVSGCCSILKQLVQNPMTGNGSVIGSRGPALRSPTRMPCVMVIGKTFMANQKPQTQFPAASLFLALADMVTAGWI